MADLYHINVPSVMMLLRADETAEPSNELLYGESIEVLEQDGEYVLVKAQHDGYEGYISMTSLQSHREKTHKISVPSTHLYQDPDFKTPPLMPLYFLSHVHVTDEKQEGFVRLANGGWVFAEHLENVSTQQDDFVETALKFEDTPYIWGGRSMNGIDCSGLVQISLMAAKIECPRDTKDQVQSIGQSLELDGVTFQRGDFIFFERHVGIMLDSENILNATSRHMQTVTEKLSDVVEAYDGITAARRIS